MTKSEYDRKYRAKRIARGVCVSCNNPLTSQTMCQVHLDKAKQNRIDSGQASPITTLRADPAKKPELDEVISQLQTELTNKRIEYRQILRSMEITLRKLRGERRQAAQALAYRAQKASGRCMLCDNPVEPNYILCMNHLTISRHVNDGRRTREPRYPHKEPIK